MSTEFPPKAPSILSKKKLTREALQEWFLELKKYEEALAHWDFKLGLRETLLDTKEELLRQVEEGLSARENLLTEDPLEEELPQLYDKKPWKYEPKEEEKKREIDWLKSLYNLPDDRV